MATANAALASRRSPLPFIRFPSLASFAHRERHDPHACHARFKKGLLMNEPNGISAPAGMPRLSAHEMAALMLLEQAPVEIERGTLDMTTLRDVGLAELIDRDKGDPKFSITRKGKVMLRMLSEWITRERAVSPANPA
ncbi:hypothetical protein [Burkholderia ubonensis]|uniref:hypothetical protein n=1 Tax=Burkholderia ubonensis TaxID=101571 RepID=UPI001E47F3DF|nr:hypothetical protein [Burkholderia ubonensis]